MSVENLRAGLSDLREGIKDRRDRKAAKEKARKEEEEKAKKEAARQSLADTLDSSLAGQTPQGQFLSSGVRGGSIDPEKAASALGDIQGKKLFYQLQSRVITEKDPVVKKKLMEVLNNATAAYNRVNGIEAYNISKQQMIGVLEAKKQFGVLHKGGGKGGGSSTPGNTENPAGLEITYDDLPDQITDFVVNDPFVKEYMPGEKRLKGFYYSDLTSDDAEFMQYQERAGNKIDAYLAKHPILGAKGMEVYRFKEKNRLLQILGRDGLQGFSRLGTSGDKIENKNLTTSIPMTQEQAISLAQQNKGIVKKTKKGDIKETRVFSDKRPLVPEPIKGKTAAGSTVMPADNYYLGE